MSITGDRREKASDKWRAAIGSTLQSSGVIIGSRVTIDAQAGVVLAVEVDSVSLAAALDDGAEAAEERDEQRSLILAVFSLSPGTSISVARGLIERGPRGELGRFAALLARTEATDGRASQGAHRDQ